MLDPTDPHPLLGFLWSHMTRQTTATCECPTCKKSSEVKIWNTINITLNPELRVPVLDGSAFAFVCPECSAKEQMAYHFLYHDMDHKFMVHWFPDLETLPEEKFAELEKVTIWFPGYRYRIVSSRNRLREKILIFEMGLDDRVVEMVKHFAWAYYWKDKGIAMDEMYFNSVSGTSREPDVELIIMPASGQSSQTFTLPAAQGYVAAYWILRDKFKVPVEEGPGWKIVDHTYFDSLGNGKE